MEERLALEIEKKIIQILISDLEIDPALLSAVSSDTPLLGRGIGLNSIETLTLVARIEGAFHIQIGAVAPAGRLPLTGSAAGKVHDAETLSRIWTARGGRAPPGGPAGQEEGMTYDDCSEN